MAAVLRDDTEAVRLLVEVMHVQSLDDKSWRNILHEAFGAIDSVIYQRGAGFEGAARNADAEWRTLWARLRLAPPEIRNQFIIEKRSRLRIRRRDNLWVLFDQVLIPGRLVADSGNDKANAHVLFDNKEHAKDTDILKQLGVSDFPSGTHGPGPFEMVVRESRNDLWEWLESRRTEYYKTVSNRAIAAYLEPFGLTMPHGWPLLILLSGVPKTVFTLHLISYIRNPTFNNLIKFGHSTRREIYKDQEVAHPLYWLLLTHGSIAIGKSIISIRTVFSRRLEPAMSLLQGWQELQPFLASLATVVKESSNPNEKDLMAFWSAMFELLATPSAVAADSLIHLWASAARDKIAPDHLAGSNGHVTLANVYVTASTDLSRRARKPERVVITLDERALSLWQKKGARNLDQVLKPRWKELLGSPDLLVSAIPELGTVLRPEFVSTARCQSVSELCLCFDESVEAFPCLMWDNMLHLDVAQLSVLPRSERLRRVISEISAAGWLKQSAPDALSIVYDSGLESRRAAVAGKATLPCRLLTAVGNRVEPLRSALGDVSERAFIEKCTRIQLADLVLALLGTATLAKLRQAFQDEGLQPPSRWNTLEARAFVASIGFPAEFAASPDSRRDAEECISGPIYLPPLHDFQEEVADGLRSLLEKGTGRRRAVVSLPTGGGKTRVVVQAAVDMLLKPQGDGRSVIWVAQTDELCEQAVQAFRQVWINRGATATDLRIFRFWGGNPNPEAPGAGMPVVVVASIQTLNSRVSNEDLDWLARPGMVVVDECHHAITKSYTTLLRWLDAEAPKPGAIEKCEPPIVGLSATPFRGTDEEESARLARRFDNLWLPKDQEKLYERLRGQGVLAQADYESIQSPAQLLADEADKLGKMTSWDGIDFENILELINQRLAGNEVRNHILLETIAASTRKVDFVLY